MIHEPMNFQMETGFRRTVSHPHRDEGKLTQTSCDCIVALNDCSAVLTWAIGMTAPTEHPNNPERQKGAGT